MNKSITLSDKQNQSLAQIQQQKANLNSLFQDLNNKESLILELILDIHQVKGTVKNVQLKDGVLTYEEESPLKVSKKKKAAIKAEEEE